MADFLKKLFGREGKNAANEPAPEAAVPASEPTSPAPVNPGRRKIELTEEEARRFQAILDANYPGLAIFVRDVNLDPALAAKYVPNLIIRERAFTDASCRVMGMVTTHRYMILSNHMANLMAYEHDTNWGLCVAQRDSHFKVLGQHAVNGKTAIILLHLPDDDSWRFFIDHFFDLDRQLLEMAKARFEAKCDTEPVPELTTPLWQDRCRFPLGMDDSGSLWPLD